MAALLLAAFYLLPWLRWDGRQAVLFDLPARRFDLFGLSLWPGDFVWLLWFAALAGCGLFLLTASAGRVWCGFGCPQTLMTRVFRGIERITAFAGPMRHPGLVARQLLWAALALWTGITFVGFFSPIRGLLGGPWPPAWSGWEIFWAGFYALATWGNAGFLREQVCSYLCPYARLQRAICDRDTPRVAYDPCRGEPRGPRPPGQGSVMQRARGLLDGTTARDYVFRATHAAIAGPLPRFGIEHLGDCVECRQCVQACPLALDIRNGSDQRCIDCGACIDACDATMARYGFPRGLVRRISPNAQEPGGGRWLRPRTLGALLLMAALLLGGALAMAMSPRPGIPAPGAGPSSTP